MVSAGRYATRSIEHKGVTFKVVCFHSSGRLKWSLYAANAVVEQDHPLVTSPIPVSNPDDAAERAREYLESLRDAFRQLL